MFPAIPIRSQDASTTAPRSMSPSIWGDCPVKGCYDESGVYGTHFDDFRMYTADTAGYGKYADTGGTLALLATSKVGVVDIATDATDNDEVYLTTGGNVAPLGALTTGKKFWLEARIACKAVTAHNTFFGLTAVAAAADNFIGDTGTVSVTNLIGFVVAEGTPTRLDYIYNKATGTVQTATTGTTLTAEGFVKVGVKGDGATIRWYVNGVEVFSASQTATNMPASGTLLQLTMGVKNGGAAAQSLYVDWVAAVMED